MDAKEFVAADRGIVCPNLPPHSPYQPIAQAACVAHREPGPAPTGIALILAGIAAIPLAFAFPLAYRCGGYIISVGGETISVQLICSGPNPAILAAPLLMVLGMWMHLRRAERATGTRAT